ncbi:MAG: hypothetical protein ACI4GD_01720 [Lachnospiraceae bacterium]
MVEYILGNYMISKGRLTREQLEKAVENQDKVRVKLGLIAVSEGYITIKQSDEINSMQEKCDKRFGDIAIEKGYMTEEQLNKVLKLQGNAYLTFVQALVDDGIIKVEEMDELLECFRKENGYGFSDVEAIKNDNVDDILSLYMPQDAGDYADIIGIVVRTIIRCIDRHAYIGKIERVEQATGLSMVFQKIKGETTKTSVFIEEEGGMVEMAGVYARDTFDEMDEDVLDAAAEFLNCVNGIYTSSIADGKVDLLPPVYQLMGADVQKDVVYRVPIWVHNKKMYYVIAE